VIEQARANNIHLLCLPGHTTHILQPLDVEVFKSFNTNFSKACSRYIAKTGRVVTTDKIATLVAEAWPVSYTALNVMAEFKKCEIFPLNPSQVGVKPNRKMWILVLKRKGQSPMHQVHFSLQRERCCTGRDSKKATMYETLTTSLG